MGNKQRTYIAIDLKSFYASVECVERGLDPLNTNLVVADPSRTEKTICLAVSPSLKQYGIPGRARLFEVNQKVRQINNQRLWKNPYGRFTGKSAIDSELKAHPEWELDFLIAMPRMAHYIQYSTRIYQVYLKYIAPEDIHVYSIDEVFIDATDYLFSVGMDSHQLAKTIILDILRQTGITATAGIGTNLYLCKVAMDIMAKKMPMDKDGVRIAFLDEVSYRQHLWDHQPLTDFWRVGRGISKRLEAYDIHTMGDIAHISLVNEEFLYKLFGVNAELLIDHAWGYEPCTMPLIKAYRPETNSISSGQVLQEGYDNQKAAVVVKEMAEAVAYELLEKHMVTDQIVLHVGYDVQNITNADRRQHYDGPTKIDFYGREVPKSAHGSTNLGEHTFSLRIITDATMELFRKIVNPDLLVRRIGIGANHVIPEESIAQTTQTNNASKEKVIQLDLFTDYDQLHLEQQKKKEALEKERRLMQATIELKKRFGKNALLKGLNYREGSTAKNRNSQIGGHHE